MNDPTLIAPELLPGALTTTEIDATLRRGREGAGDPAGLRLGLWRATSPPGAPPGAPQPCQRIQRMPRMRAPTRPSWGASRRGFAAGATPQRSAATTPHLVADLDHEIVVAFKLS